MPVFMASTTAPDRGRAEVLGQSLEAALPAFAGSSVCEVEDGSGHWEVCGYFCERPGDVALRLLAAAQGVMPFTVSELPETGWVAAARRALAPVRAGRFFLYGSHDADRVPPDCVPLLVEAATAFGTGHHGTTRGCLLALDDLLADGVMPLRAIDVGCGTAVLAMAAAKACGARVLAADNDPTAVETARENVAVNDLEDLVRVLHSDGLDHPDIDAGAPYDLVFANIVEGPLAAMSRDISAGCRAGGLAILSGLLAAQAAPMIARYDAAGFGVHRRHVLGEWETITFRKRT